MGEANSLTMLATTYTAVDHSGLRSRIKETQTLPEATRTKLAREYTCTDIAEGTSWLVSTMILFTYYNAVGEIASFRGIEFSKYVDGFTASFDRSLPIIPAFVFPYIFVYALPAAFLVVAFNQRFSMGAIRRFFAVQMMMIFRAFACYLAFPVETDL